MVYHRFQKSDRRNGREIRMERIRLMIVDDYEPLRIGLKTAFQIEEDIEVVGDFGDGETAVSEAQRCAPDVVLVDVRMPGMDGIEACRLMRDRVPDAAVVMLTSYDDERAIKASVMAGARGFLLKNGGMDELHDAVRSVANGKTLLDPALTGRVLDMLKALSVEEERGKKIRLSAAAHVSIGESEIVLSSREREVLSMIMEWRTNRQIAETLRISENTVKSHVGHILRKLGLDSRRQVADFAIQHDILGATKSDD